MVAKIQIGSGIAGCVDYVTRLEAEKKNEPKARQWHLLEANGVRFMQSEKDWRKNTARDMTVPSLSNPIKDPCGHISLDFHPDDAPKLTDAKMLAIAHEYVEGMGIANTPFILVRHEEKNHPHCHLVFSRVDFDGNVLKSATNFRRNTKVCRDITRRHGLTMGNHKLSVDTSKLKGNERIRYEMTQTIADVLKDRTITDWATMLARLNPHGITGKPHYGKDGKIRTLIFAKGKVSFVAGKLDRKFTPRPLATLFELNKIALNAPKAKTTTSLPNTPKPSPSVAPSISLSQASPTANEPTMDLGHGLPDDFKLWLARHPGMTLDEARTRYKEEQKAKQRRNRPKLH